MPMERALCMVHSGDHVGHTLEEKPGLVLKDIIIIEETILYMSMSNTTTQSNNGENI